MFDYNDIQIQVKNKPARFVLENIALRLIGGKVPPYWLMGRNDVREVDSDDFEYIRNLSDEELSDMVRTNALGLPMAMPLELQIEEAGAKPWLLPFEPMISITGKNVIKERNVSKGEVRGTIKERWTGGDYEINIEGILMSADSISYPKEDVAKLRQHLEACSLKVLSPLLEIYGINRIVVKSFDFPFTAGLGNQNYSISAVSDYNYKLFLGREEYKGLKNK